LKQAGFKPNVRSCNWMLVILFEADLVVLLYTAAGLAEKPGRRAAHRAAQTRTDKAAAVKNGVGDGLDNGRVFVGWLVQYIVDFTGRWLPFGDLPVPEEGQAVLRIRRPPAWSAISNPLFSRATNLAWLQTAQQVAIGVRGVPLFRQRSCANLASRITLP